MTNLIKRNQVLLTKSVIASELAKIQRAFFDDEMLELYESSNEGNLYWEMFDQYNGVEIEYPTFNKTIGIEHHDIETFTDELSAKLVALFKSINTSEFYIIAHLKLDFFGNRENQYEPLCAAYEKLEKIVGAKTYNEAFEVNLQSLSDFIEILFWTSRCDPSVAEYIFLFDIHEQFQMSLCKYGNLHLTEFHAERLTASKLKELGWKIIEGQEFDKFSHTGSIEGRSLKME